MRWSTRFVNRLLAGDEPGAWGVVEAALASAPTAEVQTTEQYKEGTVDLDAPATDTGATISDLLAHSGGVAPDAPTWAHVERIEQCGDRTVVTAAGIIHDFHTDGTLRNGSRDVEQENPFALLELMRDERAWVKISGAERLTADGPPPPDAFEYAQARLDAVLLEMAGVPTLGSDALTLSTTLDKAWTNRAVAAAGDFPGLWSSPLCGLVGLDACGNVESFLLRSAGVSVAVLFAPLVATLSAVVRSAAKKATST